MNPEHSPLCVDVVDEGPTSAGARAVPSSQRVCYLFFVPAACEWGAVEIERRVLFLGCVLGSRGTLGTT